MQLRKLVAAGLLCVCLSGYAEVSQVTMRNVYEKLKTPYKYGVVMEESGAELDSVTIFREGDFWYMTYILFDGAGYETRLAQSDDLLYWRKLGTVFARPGGDSWDANQRAGYVALVDTTWGGSYAPKSYNGRYWMSYLGGNSHGYEAGLLSIGMAQSGSASGISEWKAAIGKPILTMRDADTRWFENVNLFKSTVIFDEKKSLGSNFVMFYNSQSNSGGVWAERIGIAVSDDMLTWRRRGKDPVIDNGQGISGDPQIIRMDSLWVMPYFGAFFKPGAFDTFACSYDLEHWTTWKGPDLVASSVNYDSVYAHKPWIVNWNGVVYHFYTGVGDRGRIIALATSKRLK